MNVAHNSGCSFSPPTLGAPGRRYRTGPGSPAVLAASNTTWLDMMLLANQAHLRGPETRASTCEELLASTRRTHINQHTPPTSPRTATTTSCLAQCRPPQSNCNVHLLHWHQVHQGPVGLMDKALASGAGDSRFESWAGHISPRCWTHVCPPQQLKS